MFSLTTVNTLGGLRTPYSAQILADQPTKYLKLNESANPIIDYSVYNRGASFPSTTFVFGSPREMHSETIGGLQFMFDGTSPHERLFFDHVLSPSSSFSIEFWFMKYYQIQNQGIMGASLASPSYLWEIMLSPPNSTTRNLVINLNNTRFTSFSWNLGYIYHVVLTFFDNQCQVYANGTLRNTFTNAAFTTFIQNINLLRTGTSTQWVLGHGSFTNRNGLVFLSNFATYDYVLASEQIARHYQLGYLWQPNDTNLIAWFKEDINSTLANSNTEITLWSNLAGTQTAHFSTGSSTQRLLSAYDGTGFYLTGGTGRYLTTASATLPASSDFFIAFSIRVMNNPVANQYIFTQYTIGTSGRMHTAVAPATGGYAYVLFVGGTTSFLLTSTTFSGTQERIVMFTRVGNTVSVYVNGVLNATSTHSTTLTIQQFRNVLGAIDFSSGGAFASMDGFMANLRIRELIIGSDVTQVNNITSYLANEYQITL